MSDYYTAPSGAPDLPWLYRRADDAPVGVVAPNGKEVLFGGGGGGLSAPVAKSQLAADVQASLGATIKSTGYDQTAELQQAANDLFASLGGQGDFNTGFAIKLVDGEEYAISNLVLPPGAALVPVSGRMVPFSDKPSDTSGATPVSTGPVLRHVIQTAPMIQNDTARMVIRSAPSGFALNTVAGMVMIADRFVSPRRGDAHFLDFRSAFGVQVVGNLAMTSAGFGLRVNSCNAMHIERNYFLYAPWFLHGLVDSQVVFNQVGGGNGFASDSVWLTGDVDNGIATRLNLWQSNLIYNNNSNGNYVSQFAKSVAVTGISGDTLTMAANVAGGGDQTTNWIGETPVVVSATTLPTATGHTMSRSKTYWVTVLADGVTLKLSKNRGDKAAGVYLNFTDGGAGVSLRVGGNANLHLNAGTTDNQFLPLRSDQSFGDAILCDGAPDNTFAALQVSYSRSGSMPGTAAAPTPGAAITLRNGSTGNQFVAGVINGKQHGAVGVGPSNQKFAFSIDASSKRGFDARGVKTINHTAANSEAGARAFEPEDLNPRRIVLSPTEFLQTAATATVNVSLVARLALSMTNAAGAAASVVIPADWQGIRARVRWANNGTATGAVTFSARLGHYELGANASSTEQALVAAPTITVAAGGEQYVLKESVIDLGASDDYIGVMSSLRLLRTDGTGPTVQVTQVILEDAV